MLLGEKMILEIKNFSKSYNSKNKAVDNLSLQINEGDIYGFIGENGAGKSTTLRSVAGILPFEEGDIIINGFSIKKNPLECKKIMAYIPDNPDIFPHLKGVEYLNFICDLYNVNREDRNKKIYYYSQKFEVDDILGNKISSYSHGTKQKIALIAALAHEPRLLVLDEPFVGLDPKAIYILKKVMLDYVKKGNAIFFSSHSLEVVEELCNKVAIIKKGLIAANGDIEVIKGDKSLESLFLELTEHV